VVALVLSRLGYGSTVLFGLPQQLVKKFQSVQNAAARLVLATHCCNHTSPLLQTAKSTGYECGMYYILVGSTYLLTIPSTVQHTNTCGNNYSQSLISALVSNSAFCRPLHYSVCRLFEPPLAAELFLLSTLVGSWT